MKKKTLPRKKKTSAGSRKVQNISVKASQQRSVDKAQTNITKTFEERLTDDLAKTLYTFTNKIVSVLQSVAHWCEKNRTTLETIHDIFELYEDELKDFVKTKQEALAILKKYRWILTPSTLPLLMVVPIVKIGKQPGDQTAAIDRWFIDHFREQDFANLELMIEDWRAIPIFEQRMTFFRDALGSLRHAARNYNPANLMIPMLIAQINGIQTEFMLRSGLLPANRIALKWRDKAGNVYNKDKGKQLFFGKETKAQPMFLSEELKSLASDYVFDELFAEAYPLEVAPSDFNRHKIQHGQALDYGTMANVIRAFLILDILAHLCKKLDPRFY